MKRFFAKVIIVLSVLTTGFIAFPMNAYSLNYWYNLLPVPFLRTAFDFLIANELYVKGGIAAVTLIFSVIYFLVSFKEYKQDQEVERSTASAAFVPIFLSSISAMIFAFLLVFWKVEDPMILFIRAAMIFLIGNLLLIGHLIGINIREKGNLNRLLMLLLLVEILAASAFGAFHLYGKWTTEAYADLHFEWYVLAPVLYLLIYIVHTIIIKVRQKRIDQMDEMDDVARSMHPEKHEDLKSEEKFSNPEKIDSSEPILAPKPAKLSKAEKKEMLQEQMQASRGKKSTIVSKEQAIISNEMDVDPTNLLYEEVSVDPEFNKTSNLDKQVSSIEYYIEKPKMFKPLDPTFDSLVSYVRELPNVVTKISDERITFYVERKPFLVLMNFGNYYRLAFRSDLEKGVRLIIKYPTISKNKGTKETLWFKANNYGDLPKEVIYDIVKSAFDNVNA